MDYNHKYSKDEIPFVDIMEHMDGTMIYDLDRSSQRLPIEKEILKEIDNI